MRPTLNVWGCAIVVTGISAGHAVCRGALFAVSRSVLTVSPFVPIATAGYAPLTQPPAPVAAKSTVLIILSAAVGANRFIALNVG
jgi:hypothetical protein